MSTGPVRSMFATMDLLRKHDNAGFEDDKARWDDEQARKKAKWADEDRASTVKERARQEEQRTGLIDAMKDVDVEDIDIATPTADPSTQTLSRAFKVGGKQYNTRAEADAARELHNSTGAKMQRAANFTLKSGNPTGAATISETGMKWDKAMRDDVKRRFEDDLSKNVKLGDWQGLESFVNNSPISPTKARFVLGPDGKQQAIGEDGQPIPGMAFPNTPEGHATASKLLFGQLTPEQQLAHIYGRQKAAADAEQLRVKNAQEERKVRADERRVQIAGNADARAQGEYDAGASGRTLAMQMDKLRLDAASDDPAVANRAKAKLVEAAAISALGKSKPAGQYKIEMNEVATALGKPSGRPDPFTGRETVNRDMAEEARFFEWMQANNMTDTNEALAKWKAGAGRAAAPSGDLVQQAREAVARGADKAKVNERLKAQGLPPLP